MKRPLIIVFIPIAKCIISYTGHLRCYCGAHVSYVVLATPPSFRSSCLESAPV
jgi:hypothetical protein